MCLLPEGPSPITSSPTPGLLFPATGTSCQSPPSLSLGCVLSFFTQLQRPHREVSLPLASQICSNNPGDRGVQSGTTSAPSLRTSCTSQACSLSSLLFFCCTLLSILISPAITYRLVDLECSLHLSCNLPSFSSPPLSHSFPSFLPSPHLSFRPLFFSSPCFLLSFFIHPAAFAFPPLISSFLSRLSYSLPSYRLISSSSYLLPLPSTSLSCFSPPHPFIFPVHPIFLIILSFFFSKTYPLPILLILISSHTLPLTLYLYSFTLTPSLSVFYFSCPFLLSFSHISLLLSLSSSVSSLLSSFLLFSPPSLLI